MEDIIKAVYEKIKNCSATTSFIPKMWCARSRPFTTEEISDKIAQLITPKEVKLPVQVIYQTIEDP